MGVHRERLNTEKVSEKAKLFMTAKASVDKNPSNAVTEVLNLPGLLKSQCPSPCICSNDNSLSINYLTQRVLQKMRKCAYYMMLLVISHCSNDNSLSINYLTQRVLQKMRKCAYYMMLLVISQKMILITITTTSSTNTIINQLIDSTWYPYPTAY